MLVYSDRWKKEININTNTNNNYNYNNKVHIIKNTLSNLCNNVVSTECGNVKTNIII